MASSKRNGQSPSWSRSPLLDQINLWHCLVWSGLPQRVGEPYQSINLTSWGLFFQQLLLKKINPPLAALSSWCKKSKNGSTIIKLSNTSRRGSWSWRIWKAPEGNVFTKTNNGKNVQLDNAPATHSLLSTILESCLGNGWIHIGQLSSVEVPRLGGGAQ